MMERHSRWRTCLLNLVLAASCLASACHKSAPSPDAGKAASGAQQPPGAKAGTKVAASQADGGDKKADGEGPEAVHLKAEEVEKLGVTTAALEAISHAPEAAGFGIVISHETIAQALADLRTAAAVARQSEAALQRGQRLAGTPGAMPLDTLEAAQRQSTVDQAALALARQRLSSTFGQEPPWKGREEGRLLNALAGGTFKLVRVSFPMNTVGEATPSTIRLGRIGVTPTASTWDSNTVWGAPADTTVPGRSFFTIIKSGSLGEGERLLAWTPVGVSNKGVLIPDASALISGGKYWCYIEAKPGTFVRTEFDPGLPVTGGYFVTSGVQPGDRVVVNAAGQLLARELNHSTEVD